MMIEFLCPNGHRIRCPEQRAGQPAKCPKCGVKFRVPDVSQAGSSSRANRGQSGPAAAEASGPTRAQQQIEFLCPNGHRLHGPASLQGRPGQCPECGSRFRIPSYDEIPEEEQEELYEEIGVVGSGSDAKATFEETEEVTEEIDEEQASGYDLGAEEVATADRLDGSGSASQHGQSHPLARLFAKLWAEKPPEAVVELSLAGGEKLTPDHFAVKASRGTHGVFAVEESSGRYTITLIAWDSVARIDIRGVKRLAEWLRG